MPTLSLSPPPATAAGHHLRPPKKFPAIYSGRVQNYRSVPDLFDPPILAPPRAFFATTTPYTTPLQPPPPRLLLYENHHRDPTTATMVVDITTSRYTITTTPIPPQHHLPPRRHCGFRLSTIKGACGFKPHEGRVWFCSQPHRGAYGSGQPPQGCVCFRGSATTRKECVVVGLWQPMRVAFGLLKPTRMRSGFGSHGTSRGRLVVGFVTKKVAF
ncbi:hypothetical protein Tco_1518635 [Tanacetum coccineum]